MIIGCNSKKETSDGNGNINSDTTKVDTIVSDTLTYTDSLKEAINKGEAQKNSLPIHGKMNHDLLDQYYHGLTDTINDLRIVGSERLDLRPGNGIIVSILHNTGTFDQMILCTHDSILNLIDKLYIGKATMFDKTSHTIEYEIVDRNSMKFDQVDWGYVKKGNKSEIDTVRSKSYSIRINKQGKIKKTMPNKTYKQ